MAINKTTQYTTDPNTIPVDTVTGSQTIDVALDSRVIFESTKADLEAISPSNLTGGQEAQVLGTPFTWDSSASEWFAQGPINVKMYGAVGDGVADDGAAIRLAIESLREGETLHFPPGHYITAYGEHTLLADWIIIDKSGVTLTAAPGTVTLENFLIAVNGSFETPIDVGASGFGTGDEVIDTSSAHGYAEGDVVQFLSQINSYSTDAGELQLGSRNPTDNTLPEFRFSEIHKVQEVINSTSFRIDSTVLYGEYADNTAGLNDPMDGVTSAQIRKINAVHGVTFYGLTFKNVDNDNFRGLYSVGCYWVTWDNCGFIAEGRPGRHIRTQNTYGVRIKNCWERRSPAGASGSPWNSFVIGGGTHNSSFSNCTFKGGQQCIDWTVGVSTTDPFTTADDLDGLTCQIMGAQGCRFEDCSDAATSHPGTYILIFHDNICTNVNIGFRGRSRNMSIQGNMIKSVASGIEVSAFYEDTLIANNNITQTQAPRFGSPAGGWSGVNISPMSSEVMNSNNILRVVIRGNTFLSNTSNAGDMGVALRHVGNGVPPSGSFTEFTDSIKTALSNYIVESNKFFRCGVKVERYINGVSCISNTFDQGGNLNAYFESADDSVRHRVGLNMFDGGQPTFSIVVGGPNELTFGYSTSHKVSNNLYAVGSPNNNLTNNVSFNTD